MIRHKQLVLSLKQDFVLKKCSRHMASEMSRQKHLIHRPRDRSYSMIRCTLDDSGNLINGRKLDRRFLPGIDTRRWETNKLSSQNPPWRQVPHFFSSFYGFLCALLTHTHVHLTLQSLPGITDYGK
jgi:hypothetical protein